MQVLFRKYSEDPIKQINLKYFHLVYYLLIILVSRDIFLHKQLFSLIPNENKGLLKKKNNNNTPIIHFLTFDFNLQQWKTAKNFPIKLSKTLVTIPLCSKK